MSNLVEPKEYLTDPSVYPGLSLLDIIEARGISQAELAQRMNKPYQAVNEIVNGKKEIIPETAIALEHVLGLPAGFWLKLESNYRESLAREKEIRELDGQIKLSKAYPYREMANNGWIKNTNDPTERVSELLRWFGVTHLNSVDNQYKVAFRKSRESNISKEKLAAWLRLGEVESQRLQYGDFTNSKDRAEELTQELRKLTLEDIRKADEEARSLCARYGIALIFTPEFKSFPVNGATRWVSGRYIVQVSLRYKWHDIFWFSIFHELGHVFLHGKEFFLERQGKNRDEKSEEDEADHFAARNLIPEGRYDDIQKIVHISGNQVKEFASEIGIHPGIVVGRLQHDGMPRNRLNYLKAKLKWVGDEK